MNKAYVTIHQIQIQKLPSMNFLPPFPRKTSSMNFLPPLPPSNPQNLTLISKISPKHQKSNMKKRWAIAALPSLVLFLHYLFFLFTYHSYMKFPFSLLLSRNATLTTEYPPSRLPLTQFSLFIGVLTRPDFYDRRHFLRLIYGTQSSAIAEIHVKFILCNLTKNEQRVFIALENIRFNDIIILNCTENMNSGKTYTYFSSLPRILSRRYDYVMKADDDVFIRLEQLALSLRSLPRIDLYYGFVIPCTSQNPFADYMSGMGFVLSWDLLEWIGKSSIHVNDTYGPEDKLVGKWFKMGNKAKNRFSNKPAMYDYPGTNGKCSHELIPETIAVHRLKRWDQWLDVLTFFNVTKGIQNSNFYHL